MEPLEQRALLAVTPIGVDVSGTLDTAGDFDVYEFAPGPGEHLVVQLDGEDHQDQNQIYIGHGSVPDPANPSTYEAAGKVAGMADQYAEIPQTQAGSYYVLVYCSVDLALGSDTYTLRADTLATLPSLGVGAEVTGSLDAYDFDIYQVSPGADEHLIVQFDNVDSLDNSEIFVRSGSVPDWTDPAKYDAAGKVLAHADQFAEVTETEDDTYFVLVRSIFDVFNGVDAYSLRADTLDTLPELEVGVETSASLGMYDFDIYQVEPGADQHLIVQFDDTDSQDRNEVYVRLGEVPDWSSPTGYDAAGNVLMHADQFAEIPETEEGTYFVLVHSSFDSSGDADAYALRADTLDTLPGLEIGVETEDSLGAYDFDIYQVEPGDDQHLIARFDSVDFQDRNEVYIRQGAVPDWSNASLNDAAGNVLGYADQFAEIDETEDDVYFVLVHCTFDSSGGADEYALIADTLATLPRLEIGVERNDPIGLYDFNIYQVEPGADKHLIVQLDDSESLDRNTMYLRRGAVPDMNDPAKYDAAGDVAAYAGQFVQTGDTQDDPYFVLVHCTTDSSGNGDDYALRADTLATLPTLEIGVEAGGSLGVHDFDIYQVEPGAARHLVVQLDAVDFLDRNAIYVRRGAVPDWTDGSKYDAAGNALGYADQVAEIGMTQDEPYFVLARSTFDADDGSDAYTLRVDTDATLPRLTPGADETGELSTWDFDIYRLHAGAGQRLVIQLDGAEYLDRHEMYLRRGAVPIPDNPSGYDAAAKTAGQSDQFMEIAEAEGGTYYLLVRCKSDSGGSDAYTLHYETTPEWPSIGAAGDSLTDEYWIGVAKTWVEVLASEKGVNFGPEGNWGEPRGEGYEYNWAKVGATSTTLLAEGQHVGLAQQFDAGAVSYGVLAIGQNDFAPLTGAYQNIYGGLWTPTEIDAFADGVYDNIETAVSTLAAADGDLVMANIIDFGLAPVTKLLFPSATSRGQVTAVLEGLNDRLESLAAQYAIPLVDMFGLANDFLGTGTSTAAEQIGGVTVQVATGIDAHNAFVDGIHPHTILQGAMGNVFLEAFSLGYGLDVSGLQFTEEELLAAAGIGEEYVSDTLTLAYSDYVILPNTGEPIDLGTVDFEAISGLDLTGGDRWYELTTIRAGELTAIGSAASGDVTVALYNQAATGPPLATSNGGTARVDHAVQPGETYLLELSGSSDNVDLALANLVATQGTEIQVFGTAGADQFGFAPTGSYVVTINGVDYDFDDTQYETIVFTGSAGDDTVTLTGGSGAEIARFFPDNGTFDGDGFQVTVNDVVEITAHGGGGADEAYLYDSAGDDEFVVRKGYGKLSGEGFVLETFDFMFNYGYATTRDGGTDVAKMEDAPENDKFKFDWPKAGQFFGKMYGGGVYYNRAKNFEQIEAVMTEGKNTVRLFDSEGDETFEGQKDESRFTGTGFDVTVSGYDSLAIYASEGIDVANLVDSEDDDTTRARSHKITLWGGDDADPTYEIMARRFDEYHFERKHGGDDRAKLHDTVLNDHATASGDTARLFRNDGELDLLYEVIGFEWVRLYKSEGEDTLDKDDPLDFDLVYGPSEWDEV